MSSIRLTKEIRRDILNGLLDRKYGYHDVGRMEIALSKEWEKKWSKKIIAELLTANERRRIAKLPKGWLPMIRHLRFFVTVSGGEKTTYKKNVAISLPESRPLPDIYDSWSENSAPKIFGIDHPISVEYAAIHKKKKEMKETIEAATATLNSVQTVKRLLEVWPEVKPFIPKHVASTKSTAVAPNRDKLNEVFGLPI